MKVLFIIALFSASAFAVNCLQIALGKCPEIPQIENFNQSRFSGQWRELKRTPVPNDIDAFCPTPQVTFDSNGNLNLRVLGKRAAGGIFDMLLVAEKTDKSNVFTQLTTIGGYQSIAIVETDYETYSIQLACNNLEGMMHAKDAFVFSRTSELSPETWGKIRDTLAKYGVAEESLEDLTKGCD